jgi:CheY-like chemotaxis protein
MELSDESLERGNTILLLERNYRTRSMHVAMLQTHGYNVEATGNEAEAHMLCQSLRPALLLIGVGEPLSAMWELCEKFQRQDPRQRIALLYSDWLQLCPVFFNGRLAQEREGPEDIIRRVQALLACDDVQVAASACR